VIGAGRHWHGGSRTALAARKVTRRHAARSPASRPKGRREFSAMRGHVATELLETIALTPSLFAWFSGRLLLRVSGGPLPHSAAAPFRRSHRGNAPLPPRPSAATPLTTKVLAPLRAPPASARSKAMLRDTSAASISCGSNGH